MRDKTYIKVAFLLTLLMSILISKGSICWILFHRIFICILIVITLAQKNRNLHQKRIHTWPVTEFCEEKIPAEMDLISLFLLRSLARVLFDESAQDLVSAD